MIVLWILQVMLDVLLIITLALWWIERRRSLLARAADEKMRESLVEWETRVQRLEKELDEYREKLQTQLAAFTKLGEEARAILIKGQHRVTGFPPSQEEEELRALIAPIPVLTGVNQKIPTLQELEKSKERFKSNMLVDLKTLLKDQLA